jgi:hypothetical protein
MIKLLDYIGSKCIPSTYAFTVWESEGQNLEGSDTTWATRLGTERGDVILCIDDTPSWI